MIDSIQTAQQIQKLILRADKRFDGFKVNATLKFSEKECQNLSDSLKIKPWTKADFDCNGLTDLLVVGSWSDPAIICILDKGGDRFELKRITRRSFQDCTFPLVGKNNDLIAIEYFFQSYPERDNWNKPRQLERKTLIYKFGDFIEANPNPSAHRIEKVEYSTTMCYGTCPVFKVVINADKTAVWHAEEYNEIGGKEVKGNFKTTIDQQRFKEIIDLLNYVDFERLKSNYAVTWTDDQTSTLIITYDGGKTKSITDYGLIGTYGLDRVYQLLFELRENQNWTK
ncbi:MAG: hypothetical protein EOO10_11065 [Chitinophagaceae bacterium]|nr:MAG: hypothetical protein EOO10_11065 [Chitinophagaceae bacterium]